MGGKYQRSRIQRLVLRVGVVMRPRDPAQRPERVTGDHTVLAMETTCPDGADGWSFIRGRNRGVREFWYVRAEDVTYPDDFPDAQEAT